MMLLWYLMFSATVTTVNDSTDTIAFKLPDSRSLLTNLTDSTESTITSTVAVGLSTSPTDTDASIRAPTRTAHSDCNFVLSTTDNRQTHNPLHTGLSRCYYSSWYHCGATPLLFCVQRLFYWWVDGFVKHSLVLVVIVHLLHCLSSPVVVHASAADTFSVLDYFVVRVPSLATSFFLRGGEWAWAWTFFANSLYGMCDGFRTLIFGRMSVQYAAYTESLL